MPKCTDFKFKLKEELQNWFDIGRSVNGHAMASREQISCNRDEKKHLLPIQADHPPDLPPAKSKEQPIANGPTPTGDDDLGEDDRVGTEEKGGGLGADKQHKPVDVPTPKSA